MALHYEVGGVYFQKVAKCEQSQLSDEWCGFCTFPLFMYRSACILMHAHIEVNKVLLYVV